MQPAFIAAYRSLRAQGALASDAFAAADAQRRKGGAYRLPPGMTWARLAESRATWDTPRRMLPVVVAHGVIGWAIPSARDLGAICPQTLVTMYRKVNDCDLIAIEARKAGDHVTAAQWERLADEESHAYQWARHAANADCVRNGAAL